MYRYRISGLSVSSDVEIEGLFPGPDGEVDVAIRRGPVPEALDGAVAEGPTWAMAPGRFLLRIPGIVRFLLSDGRTILHEAESSAAAGDVAAFLLGAAFGILLQQRDHIVLHASAVRVNGKAVVLLGPSGAGKSTLAAALGRHGYPLVTDELCHVRIDGAGVPWVHPDTRTVRLWAAAIERLDLAPHRGAAVRRRLEKFHVEPPHEPSPEPLPVGAVYALREARAPLLPGIDRPNLVDAALILRNNAFRPRLVAQLDQKVLYFQLAVAVGNRAGLFRLTRELTFPALPGVISALERHWAEPSSGVA